MSHTNKADLFLSYFTIFGIYDCHLFFKKLVDKKNVRVKFDVIYKANEEFVSVIYGCIRFIDSYQFWSSSLVSLVRTLVFDVFEILRKEFSDKCEDLSKKLAYAYEIFNSFEDCQKPIDKLKKKTS